ncbi:MbnP family copper-binding protein [Leptospira sp. 'Mane']|uniref:MbnP family copper-binding protein n=1 Tax=Leptospira sp. 'Mane' TaxID=3387407 RepID=UPI00398AEA84
MKKLLFIICIAAFSIANCKGKEKSDDTTNIGLLAIAASLGSGITEIPFQIVAGDDTSVKCNKLITAHSGSSADVKHISESMNFYIKDARFYIHDVKLVNADGSTVDFTLTADNKWQTSKVALLDFEDKTGDCTGTTETNTSIKGTAPSGNYVGIQFKVGIPFDLNHLNSTTADAPLNNSAMFWAWASGYIFMKFDWLAKEGAGSSNSFHLGSVGCNGSGTSVLTTSCTYPNRPTITIKTSGSVSWNPTAKPVYFDVKNLVNGTNSNLSSSGKAYTCMAGNNGGMGGTTAADCKILLNNVGVNETDGTTASTQSAFYLKP